MGCGTKVQMAVHLNIKWDRSFPGPCSDLHYRDRPLFITIPIFSPVPCVKNLGPLLERRISAGKFDENSVNRPFYIILHADLT